MFALSTQGFPFEQLAEDEHNNESSSDGGSASNSDAEPEIIDSEIDESDVLDLTENTLCGRSWQQILPKNANGDAVQHFSNNGSLTAKSKLVENIDECFHLFINEDIMDIIILYTNKKAEESMPPNKQWKPVDRIEMDAFFGLLLLIGRFKESRESKHDLWKANEALCRQYYAAIMSRDRFTAILRYIRFDNPTTREKRKSNDKLAPLRDVANIFIQNCKDSYNATDVGCLNEQLVTFRGCCSFKVYMPQKTGKYGMKIWSLCDSKTFYCCNMDIYTGNHEKTSKEQQERRIIENITNFWENSGRSVTIDNFDIDFSLAEELFQKKIFLVGKVRKNNRDLPKSLVDVRNRQLYSSEFLFTNELTLVSYIPRPRKCITLLSTLHHEPEVSSEEDNFKPNILKFYNSTKSGAEAFDKIIKDYSCRLHIHRWPLSLFLHFIDIAAYNAFVIWNTKHPTWKEKCSIRIKRKLFLEELSKKLTANNIDRRASAFENKEIGLHKSVINAIEATGRNIVKQHKATGLKRARCCYCIGSNNKYSTVCNYCERYVCYKHSMQSRTVICNACNFTNANDYLESGSSID